MISITTYAAANLDASQNNGNVPNYMNILSSMDALPYVSHYYTCFGLYLIFIFSCRNPLGMKLPSRTRQCFPWKFALNKLSVETFKGGGCSYNTLVLGSSYASYLTLGVILFYLGGSNYNEVCSTVNTSNKKNQISDVYKV